MNQAVIGVGSNIEPEKQISRLRKILKDAYPDHRESVFVETEPIDRPDQPKYLNGAVLIETASTKEELESWLRGVERKLGRVRSSDKYAARTMDLDILVWNRKVIDSDVRDRPFLKSAIRELLPDQVWEE